MYYAIGYIQIRTYTIPNEDWEIDYKPKYSLGRKYPESYKSVTKEQGNNEACNCSNQEVLPTEAPCDEHPEYESNYEE